MAAFTVSALTRQTTNPGYEAANAGGDTFTNTGKELVIMKNEDVSATTVTFVTSGTTDGNAISDLAVSVPAGDERVVGNLDPNVYGSTVSITYSSATSLSLAVFTMAKATA